MLLIKLVNIRNATTRARGRMRARLIKQNNFQLQRYFARRRPFIGAEVDTQINIEMTRGKYRYAFAE